MTATTRSPQRPRTGGARIVLSTGQGHDPDKPGTQGMSARSSGYQAPMTQPQDSQIQQPRPDTESAPRVLLVDDAAAIRNALRGVLEDAGVEVVGEAPDGVRASPWPAHSAPTWC